MKYKITFLGSPVGSLKREVYTVITENDSADINDIIIKAIYQGQNEKGMKFVNVSWGSIEIKPFKGGRSHEG